MEQRTYWIALALINLLYLAGVWLPEETWFGFCQWQHAGWLGIGLYALLGAVLVWQAPQLTGTARRLQEWLYRQPGSPWRLALVGAAGFGLFYLFASNTLNPDGEGLVEKLPRDILSQRGAHITHDEILELYVHSKVYALLQWAVGFSVKDTYQLLSALAGGCFLTILLAMCIRLNRDKAGLLALLCVSGGTMQLFFGDVENYTITTTLLALFVLTGLEYIEGRTSLLVPTLVMALAMMFHLLAGWFLPGLLYLWMHARKQKEPLTIVYSGALAAAICAATIGYFHFNGLPIWDLFFNSHAMGHGDGTLSMFATPDHSYYLAIVNVVFLLFPGAALLPLLLAYKRIRLDRTGEFLLATVSALVVFTFLWKAQLGVLNDWNLFAPGILFISLWAYSGLAKSPLFTNPRLAVGGLCTFSFHSYCWIVSNHLGG